MPLDLEDRTPAELIRELFRIKSEVEEHQRRTHVAEARIDEIKAVLNPLFVAGRDRYFHGNHSDILVIRGYRDHFTIQSIELEWLHSLEFPHQDQPQPSRMDSETERLLDPAHAVTDDVDL